MIYFVQSRQTHHIKIGTTKNFANCYEQLCKQYGELELLCVLNGTVYTEHGLHKQFAKHHVKDVDGEEWFYPDRELLEFIKQQPQVQLDLNLPPRKPRAYFRSHLAALRKRHKVSRMDLVRHANLTYPTVCSWEKEKMLRLEAGTTSSLMEYFDCSFDELIYTVTE